MQFKNPAGTVAPALARFSIELTCCVCGYWLLLLCTSIQNIKAVFDAAIKVVLQPPKQKKRKKKVQKGCTIL
jgi:hypothetical protein